MIRTIWQFNEMSNDFRPSLARWSDGRHEAPSTDVRSERQEPMELRYCQVGKGSSGQATPTALGCSRVHLHGEFGEGARRREFGPAVL